MQYLVANAPRQALPDLTQQVLSHHPGACFLTQKYPELFYPLRIGFWEVVGDTAAQHVLWLAARKPLVK